MSRFLLPLPPSLPPSPTYQNIVPRAIHKGNVSLQLPHLSILLKHIRSRRALRAVVPWDAVFGRVAFVDLGVGIAEGRREGRREGVSESWFMIKVSGFHRESRRTSSKKAMPVTYTFLFCLWPRSSLLAPRSLPSYPSLIVIFRSSSGLVLTVFTPLIALTTVDFPCAT